MLARNEDWVIGMSARAVLLWADHLVILDHCSTDQTPNIAAAISREHPGRVTIMTEPDPTWEEMRHRSRMLAASRALNASHYCTVDADEILTANLIPRIRSLIDTMPAHTILQLPWVCMARGIDRYYAGGIWYNNWVSMAFRDSPELHWSSGARNGYDFHHRHPMGRQPVNHQPIQQHVLNHGGGLMHLQFVNERRLKAKQAMYQLTERLRWPNREPVEAVRHRYQPAVYDSDPAKVRVAGAYPEWWGGYEALLAKHFSPASEPWQIPAMRDMLATHPELGTGLDLFGLADELTAIPTTKTKEMV